MTPRVTVYNKSSNCFLGMKHLSLSRKYRKQQQTQIKRCALMSHEFLLFAIEFLVDKEDEEVHVNFGLAKHFQDGYALILQLKKVLSRIQHTLETNILHVLQL
jgi:hypothetical protein